MMTFLKQFSSIWEAAQFTIIVIVSFCILVITVQYAISEKKFRGYYLSHTDGVYKIYIDWDNAPDEVAYKSYDGTKILKVFKQLQDINNNKNNY